jgi:hypothetical protein
VLLPEMLGWTGTTVLAPAGAARAQVPAVLGRMYCTVLYILLHTLTTEVRALGGVKVEAIPLSVLLV